MRLLDLFCGAGGCSVGYHRAGFDVEGWDITPHPDYPYRLTVGDAMTALVDVDYLSTFDAVHASPPCQAYTTASTRHRDKPGRLFTQPALIWGAENPHAEHLEDVLRALEASPVPAWVVENVPGARRVMPAQTVTLSGGMFGLSVDRPRLFASNVALVAPAYVAPSNPIGVYGREPDGRWLWKRRDGSTLRAARSLEEGRAAMGIDWMSWPDLTEAIPPAYTEHIGRQLMAHLRAEVAA